MRFLDAHQLKKISPYPFMSKISDDLFYFSHFSQFLPFLSLFFLNIFPDAPLSWMPEPFFTFYAFTLTFSTFTYAFFQKTPSLDAPGWMPGAVAPCTPPLCTPLVINQEHARASEVGLVA